MKHTAEKTAVKRNKDWTHPWMAKKLAKESRGRKEHELTDSR